MVRLGNPLKVETRVRIPLGLQARLTPLGGPHHLERTSGPGTSRTHSGQEIGVPGGPPGNPGRSMCLNMAHYHGAVHSKQLTSADPLTWASATAGAPRRPGHTPIPRIADVFAALVGIGFGATLG